MALELKRSKIAVIGDEEWGATETLDEYIEYASGGLCFDCKLPVEHGEGQRDKWKYYHKKCLGIYDSVKNK